MSSEFMPMALDSLARQQSARAAGSGASSRICLLYTSDAAEIA